MYDLSDLSWGQEGVYTESKPYKKCGAGEGGEG